MLNCKNFKKPPARYAPGYFWCINSKMDADSLIAQLKEMADKGARSVCMHPIPREFRWSNDMSPAYLSEEFHAIMEKVFDAACKMGLHWYLYDEGGWPSGSACGQVWASNPEKFSRSYAELDENGNVRIVKTEGHPERCAVVPDVLVPGVTEKFIELTHESYAKYMRTKFGKNIIFAFTDEPAYLNGLPGKLSWTDDLPEQFKRRKGYDLMPHVYDLLTASPMPGSRIAEILLDYRDVLADLFVERYLNVVQKWCKENNLLSGGHFGGEDQWHTYNLCGFGNILRSLRALDFPGVDMIWHQLYPGERLHPFPKLASSAAHQNGNKQVLGELFAIYGSGQKPKDMKYLIDYTLVCGINTYVFSSISQANKDGNMSHVSFGPTSPLWEYFGEFHNYVARMSYLMAQGKPVIDTALFFDERSFLLGGITNEYAVYRAQKTADTLLEGQCDFDYIDDRMLVEAKLKGGKLIAGKMKYSRLVLPGKCLFSAEAEKKIAALRAAGFPVFDGEDPAALSPLVKLDHPEKALRVTKRDLGNGEFSYFIFNTSPRKIKIRLTLGENAPVAAADPVTGEFYAVENQSGSFEWTFKPGESLYFVTGNSPVTGTAPAEPGDTVKVLDKTWKLRPLQKTFPGLHEYETLVCDTPAVPAKLGDWRNILGDDFSGKAVYTTTFRVHDTSEIGFIDLGEVCYASRVRLNGKDLGSCILGDFIFPVKDALRCGVNHLEITVSNTLANAVNAPAVQEYWSKTFPYSFYMPLQRSFEKNSLRSGLIGPVRLRKK